MIRPEELKSSLPLMWSPGTGTDVWEMICAAIAGDLGTIERLVKNDPSLVRSHFNYRTPLYFAVRENRADVAAFLLDHGTDPLALAVNDSLLEITRDRGYAELEKLLASRIATLHGASPQGDAVAAAVRHYDPAKTRELLNTTPALLHAGDSHGRQPIHWAVMTRQIDIIDDLLARGADINARRQDGARPIHLTNGDYGFRGWRDVPRSVRTTPAEVLAHLRARGAYVDICTAAHIGDLACVRELLDADPTLANRVSEYITYYLGSGSPLRNAAATGQIEIVKLLLERGADPNLSEEGIAPRGGALHAAVAGKYYEVAKLLLEHGADPDAEVESSGDCVFFAIRNGDLKTLDLLASYGGIWKINTYVKPPLTYDEIAAHVRRTVRVLAANGDIHAAESMFAANPALADDPEALSAAAGSGHESFVRLLLRHQPRLATCVTVVAKTRELTELLFARGMNPNLPNWLNITPLHQAVEHGKRDRAALWVDHGADLNARDEDICSTPLGWAAKFGRFEMVEFLLSRGAKTNLPDDPPWATPLAWATRRGHVEIAGLLEQHGAK